MWQGTKYSLGDQNTAKEWQSRKKKKEKNFLGDKTEKDSISQQKSAQLQSKGLSITAKEGFLGTQAPSSFLSRKFWRL